MATTHAHVLPILLCLPFLASAQTSQPCPRFQAGSAVTAPRDYFSGGGVLNISLAYQTSMDDNGNPLYCFTAPDGSQNPTLHINPGDHLIMNITNQVPEQTGFGMMSSVHNHMHMQAARKPGAKTTSPAGVCDINQDGSYTAVDVQNEINEVLGGASPFDDLNADGGVNVVDVEIAMNAAINKGCSASTAVTASCTSSTMTPASVNVHFHGTNTPSTCHQDEVITTIVNSGETFQYDLVIPAERTAGPLLVSPARARHFGKRGARRSIRRHRRGRAAEYQFRRRRPHAAIVNCSRRRGAGRQSA